MDPPLVLAGLFGAFWSLPSVCFGALAGGLAAGALFGSARAPQGALLGILAGGLLAGAYIVSEFERDRLLGTLLLGTALVPAILAGTLAGWLWSGTARALSAGGGGRGRP